MTWSMTTRTQSRWSTMDAQRQRSTLHRLSVVCPTNDNHEGPVPPGAGRERFASTRCTTFLSMSTPTVCEMMRAIRGHPNRGLRELSSTLARMSDSLGPFGPGFFGRAPLAHWAGQQIGLAVPTKRAQDCLDAATALGIPDGEMIG